MSKVKTLAEIVSEIPNGAEIGLGGFIINRCPMAFAEELIRQDKKDLVLYSVMGTMEADLLVGAGCVKSYSYGGGSLDRFGKLSRVNESIEKGSPQIIEYSGLSLAQRMLAGSMGVPYIPTKTIIGSEILEKLMLDESIARMGTNPFDGEPYLFLSALQPEYTVIHAQAADSKGNIILEGPVWDIETAKAGKKLIVTVERLVSNEYIKQFPEKVLIPSMYTYAVAVVPGGAVPAAVYKYYDYNAEQLTIYAKANQKQETFDEYLAKYITGTKDHNEVLMRMGGLDMLNSIQADPVYNFARKGDDA